MTKLRTLVRGPGLTQTGYGSHTRQILFALLNDPVFDLYFESCPWGICSFLTEDTNRTRTLRQLSHRYELAKHQQQDKDWDLFITVTIPNEFQRRGKINVGVTAGTETDRVSPDWLNKCNEMNYVVVPSDHAKKGIGTTVLSWQNQQTQETGQLKLERPIVVCAEGFDPKVFYPHIPVNETIRSLELPADFNFLVVGQWGKGGYGEDRKNIANTILYFCKAFQNRKDVGLVLKINMAKNSEIDYEMVADRIKQIKSNMPDESAPPIHLIHGNLSDEEMSDLYCHPKIKAFLSLTHGEGFGLPLLEAAACQLPIIATNWSGHLDFLQSNNSSEKLFSPVSYEVKTIPQAAIWEPVIVKDSQWAVPDESDAIHRMRKMVEAYSKPQEWARKLAKQVNEKFTVQAVQQQFLSITKEYLQKSMRSQSDTPEALQSVVENSDAYNIIYTMPMSTGDVFVSTAVLDGVFQSVSKEHKEVHIYVATLPQFADVLLENPNVYKVIPWTEGMMNIDMLEQVFDLVLTPNVATQFTFSNWVRNGQGRLLAEELANHCQVELGNYFIKKDTSVFTDVLTATNGNIDLRHTPYLTFHPGSGKGQWEARKYVEWREVLTNLKGFYPDLTIVQVGAEDEPSFKQVDIDLRGKTSVHQLASIVEHASLHLSIDTFTMHLAAASCVPLLALFGSSHARSTGPWFKDRNHSAFILLESENKMGCKKACYKYQCKVNRELPCINEIDANEVTNCALKLLSSNKSIALNSNYEYQRIFGTISGYTTSYNATTMGYPFIESIYSMLGCCDEVIVVDHSTDGTYEVLEKLAQDEPRIQLYQREWDQNNPTMDGDAKAYARALCQYDYCWQQDLDEVIHEDDYEKIRWITKRFPTSADVLHLPVVECWGDADHVTGRRHSWKWRMSRNKPNITHSVNKHARLTNEETGQVYAKEGMSDGCEYVDIVTYEPLSHTGFYTQELEELRVKNPSEYGRVMNLAFSQIPSVYHYSWFNIAQKIEQFKLNWTKQWNMLYQKQLPLRFPNCDDFATCLDTINKLKEQGGEASDAVKYKFKLDRKHPAVMTEWIKENTEIFKATG